ncbi:glycerol-3-phosphate acyltransferase PlsY [Desulfosalsimonas propionicica]|uniref:Glycerol-3-phosphate acyltransferase PlsY n=1 Tax=Desulfosalsimonas propionicica TaxID=332175 RepID=A0A7W0HLU9_9BACT|nr:hypothetical protein [Desulfosalsimonas propionicica]MBA2882695.1 glycerol-3-phosphate acyltransferase PlsY [Desulfosalsimonas propionicica]
MDASYVVTHREKLFFDELLYVARYSQASGTTNVLFTLIKKYSQANAVFKDTDILKGLLQILLFLVDIQIHPGY